MIGKDVLATAVAVPVTPFDAAGDIDLGAHAALLGRLVSAGSCPTASASRSR